MKVFITAPMMVLFNQQLFLLKDTRDDIISYQFSNSLTNVLKTERITEGIYMRIYEKGAKFSTNLGKNSIYIFLSSDYCIVHSTIRGNVFGLKKLIVCKNKSKLPKIVKINMITQITTKNMIE